jgi:uncharacterized membrane protein
MNLDSLTLLLIAAYLRKLIDANETDAETANGITADLERFRLYMDNLDKSNIE